MNTTETTLTVKNREGKAFAVPFNFGLGAAEAFCESKGIDSPDGLGEIFAGPNPLRAIREFLLSCCRYYYADRGQECPYGFDDFTRFVDWTGGPVQSTFLVEAITAYRRTWGVEDEPGTAPIVDTEGQPTKNLRGRNSAPKRSAKSA